MQQRDIVVVGGSAGSSRPLKTILGNLAPGFPGATFVVMHLSSDMSPISDRQLSSWSPLPVSHPKDMERIEPGHVYVARPDNHLTLEPGRMRVLRGPRENRHRPAIDPLFRSAAREYGPRVIGIMLSGRQDDGSAGLYAVKQQGGIAIVQDPKEAATPEMPHHALAYASPHYVLRARDIAATLVNLVNSHPDEIVMLKKHPYKASTATSTGGPEANLKTAYSDEGEGTPSVFACPECHGVLWELKEKNLVRFRCRVGHSSSSESLARELSEASEAALWAAMRALEEKAAMQRRMAETMRIDKSTAIRLRDQSAADEVNARLIRDMIFERDSQLEVGEEKTRKSA